MHQLVGDSGSKQHPQQRRRPSPLLGQSPRGQCDSLPQYFEPRVISLQNGNRKSRETSENLPQEIPNDLNATNFGQPECGGRCSLQTLPATG